MSGAEVILDKTIVPATDEVSVVADVPESRTAVKTISWLAHAAGAGVKFTAEVYADGDMGVVRIERPESTRSS